MIIQDQTAVIDFLSSARAFGAEEGTPVEHIETHISEVFLCGNQVFKLKRAVKLPVLDFSTPEQRLNACNQEVETNRRTAPTLYKGVRAIAVEPDGTLAIDGRGEVLDWVVEMDRFDEDGLYSHQSAAGELERLQMEELADAIAVFHAAAQARPDGGGASGMAATIEGNAATFAEMAGGILDKDKVRQLTNDTWAVLDELTPFLEMRRTRGCVRYCHGDLHLRNICQIDGKPVLFDAIEFNESLNTIDVLYDLAFLLMDLDVYEQRQNANIVMNRYLDIIGGAWGLTTLPLFMSLRAAIRSHVACSAAQSAAEDVDVTALENEARLYLDKAISYLHPPEPRLIAVGGLSGSGKSRMGRELAPQVGCAPGARIVRSDTLRKRIAGVHPLDRLGAAGYTPEMTEKTYSALYEEADTLLSAGYSVIADAVFSKPEERAAIERVARENGVPFDGLWLEAPAEVMAERVTKRKMNPSDADASVVEMQLAYDLGDITWTRIDSSGSREETVAIGREAIKLAE